VLFGNNRLSYIGKYHISRLVDFGTAGLLLDDLHKVPQVNIGRWDLTAKDAGVTLGIGAAAGYGLLISFLKGENELVQAFVQYVDFSQVNCGQRAALANLLGEPWLRKSARALRSTIRWSSSI
jgi:hypothetical protein